MKSYFDELMEMIDKRKVEYDEWLEKSKTLSIEDLWQYMYRKLQLTEEISNHFKAIKEKYPKSETDSTTVLAGEFLNRFWAERFFLMRH